MVQSRRCTASGASKVVALYIRGIDEATYLALHACCEAAAAVLAPEAEPVAAVTPIEAVAGAAGGGELIASWIPLLYPVALASKRPGIIE